MEECAGDAALAADVSGCRDRCVLRGFSLSSVTDALQARLEEARNALAEEALAYYPEVRL